MLKRSDVEKLYALSALKHDYGVNSFLACCEGDWEDNGCAEKRKAVDVVINDKIAEIKKESADYADGCTALFVARLFDVIGSRSVSRCMKVLEVLGVELDEA